MAKSRLYFVIQGSWATDKALAVYQSDRDAWAEVKAQIVGSLTEDLSMVKELIALRNLGLRKTDHVMMLRGPEPRYTVMAEVLLDFLGRQGFNVSVIRATKAQPRDRALTPEVQGFLQEYCLDLSSRKGLEPVVVNVNPDFGGAFLWAFERDIPCWEGIEKHCWVGGKPASAL